MELSRQESWSGLLFPSPGDFPNPGIKPRSPALQSDSLPFEPPGKLLAILWNSAFSWVYLSLSLAFHFSQLFIKPLQTTTLPSCISFSLGWFCHCLLSFIIILSNIILRSHNSSSLLAFQFLDLLCFKNFIFYPTSAT